MVSRAKFETIKSKHGRYASWAVWAAVGARPTSNVGELSALDPEVNRSLLETLNPTVVMLGLNISRPVDELVGNFHDNRSAAKDFKIRFALSGTRLYGAYMTDVLKFFVQRDSSKVMRTVTRDEAQLQRSAEMLREEFRDLDAGRPEIFAFGKDAATLVRLGSSPATVPRRVSGRSADPVPPSTQGTGDVAAPRGRSVPRAPARPGKLRHAPRGHFHPSAHERGQP